MKLFKNQSLEYLVLAQIVELEEWNLVVAKYCGASLMKRMIRMLCRRNVLTLRTKVIEMRLNLRILMALKGCWKEFLLETYQLKMTEEAKDLCATISHRITISHRCDTAVKKAT